MRRRFFLSLFFLPIIILGIFLAIWQYQRSLWKMQIIAEYKQNIYQKPQSLPVITLRTKGDKQSVHGFNETLFQSHIFMPLHLTGRFKNDLIYYRPVGEGLELITAFETKEGIIAVNVGKLPYAAKDIDINKIIPNKEYQITGFYRIAQPYKGKIPKHQALVGNIPFGAFYDYYQKDILSGAIQIDDKTKISDYLRGRSANFYIQNIPNNHIQYMWTWIFLTVIAAVIYCLLLRQMIYTREG